jgi:ubiquitin carboxyl-terminal hydrolase 7
LIADKAFAKSHMPELHEEVEDFAVYTWNLQNWKKLENKMTSPEFQCGGHSW